jgi:hypothetical protein
METQLGVSHPVVESALGEGERTYAPILLLIEGGEEEK